MEWQGRKSISEEIEESHMNWIQVLTVVLANVGWCTTMFLWLRKEANADRKELSSSISESRKEINELKVQIAVLKEKIKGG
jgi:hypothetical protein